MKITIRINDLIEAHKDGYSKCSGCEKCDEIKKLRNALESGYRDVSLVEKGDGDMALTKEKLQTYLNEGKSTKEITELESVTPATVYTLKSKYGLSQTRKNKTAVVENSKSVRQESKNVVDMGGNVEELNKPSHYHYGGLDVIGFGEINYSKAEMVGFYRMNILKYVHRYHEKNGMDDLMKAKDYLNRLIKLESVEGEG